jgi:hypothetical protein
MGDGDVAWIQLCLRYATVTQVFERCNECRARSSGLLTPVVRRQPDVSDEHVTSIFMVEE